MVENFGGSTLYLILYIIQLLGLSFYSYLVLFNPKKIINDYQVGDGAIAPIRLIGSFIVPIVLIGIYLLFTSIEGAWIYFVFGFLTSLYQLTYDLGTRYGIIDKGYTVINKTEDTILSIVFVVVNVVLIYGLQDKIYGWKFCDGCFFQAAIWLSKFLNFAIYCRYNFIVPNDLAT